MLATGPARPARTRRGLRRVLGTLCLTEITSWGVLYYAFPVLAARISIDTGWPVTSLMAAFSLSLVVSGLLGIAVGRWLDRYGPRWLMSAGSLLSALSVTGIALAPGLTMFLVAWVVAGVAMSAVLYAPAFAALTRWFGDQRVKALTVLTLAAGLASTVFAPLTAALEAQLGWRHAYLVLAALLVAVTVPAHLIGLRLPWPPSATIAAHPVPPLAIIRSRPFLSLVLALVLASCASHAVLINLVPLLGERGIGPGAAAVVLGVGGAGQVLGRLGYPRFADRLGVRVRTAAVLGGIAVTTALLAALTSLATVIVVAVLAGMVRGVFTLLQATAVTDRWGVRHYGTLSGTLSAPLTLAAAVAPFIGAALAAQLGGYTPMLWTMVALASVAAVLGLVTVPRPRNSANGSG
ncbi:MAG TPA: MFS transporter [Propionibacteriaceae bacterium]|nr:MFS transporter [Propionibacteriaceae bacterium]